MKPKKPSLSQTVQVGGRVQSWDFSTDFIVIVRLSVWMVYHFGKQSGLDTGDQIMEDKWEAVFHFRRSQKNSSGS
jgi:hypothetical protein